jgi:hypothetical protein
MYIENSKYYPLYQFLKKSNSEVNSYTFTFKQIELILRFELPSAAYKHNAWWSNDSGNHVQANSWLQAEWKTSNVVPGEKVTFYRA